MFVSAFCYHESSEKLRKDGKRWERGKLFLIGKEEFVIIYTAVFTLVRGGVIERETVVVVSEEFFPTPEVCDRLGVSSSALSPFRHFVSLSPYRRRRS